MINFIKFTVFLPVWIVLTIIFFLVGVMVRISQGIFGGLSWEFDDITDIPDIFSDIISGMWKRYMSPLQKKVAALEERLNDRVSKCRTVNNHLGIRFTGGGYVAGADDYYEDDVITKMRASYKAMLDHFGLEYVKINGKDAVPAEPLRYVLRKKKIVRKKKNVTK